MKIENTNEMIVTLNKIMDGRKSMVKTGTPSWISYVTGTQRRLCEFHREYMDPAEQLGE